MYGDRNCHKFYFPIIFGIVEIKQFCFAHQREQRVEFRSLMAFSLPLYSCHISGYFRHSLHHSELTDGYGMEAWRPSFCVETLLFELVHEYDRIQATTFAFIYLFSFS